MSKGKKNQLSGNEIGHEERFTQVFKFYDRKLKECPPNVTLYKARRQAATTVNYYIQLQFINPVTGKRSTKTCGITSFTEESVIDAVQKAHKVANALKTITKASEFWEWYNREILGKNEIENDLITYREIFKDIEDKYFFGKHRNTKRKRVKDINQLGSVSDLKSFKCLYGDIFKKFPDWDKYPTWDEIKKVWFSMGTKTTGTDSGQGTKSFENAKIAIKAICERCPNSDELLKKLNKIDATQTIFTEKQSIALDDFLKWYHQAYDEIPSIKRQDRKLARQSWLWVASMCVLYGLRPSEIASAQNLTKSITIDGETVYPLTDKERNQKATIVIGEFTYFGASTKTGLRPVNPVPLDYLWDELEIRNPMLPIYSPRKGTKPENIASGFDSQFGDRMNSYDCPITQQYAFRHLNNQILEMCGIPVAIRSRLMGHSESANTGDYKSRRNFKSELAIINANHKQPLSYDLAIKQLQRLGVNIESDDAKLFLGVIYQIDN
jgi:integrase